MKTNINEQPWEQARNAYTMALFELLHKKYNVILSADDLNQILLIAAKRIIDADIQERLSAQPPQS